MFIKSGLFLFLLTAFQVSARYKGIEPTNIENEINPEYMAVSSSSARIVSGWEAEQGQFPYHAALRTVATDGVLWRFGGAIVSNQWVVTVASATVDLESVTVRVGLSFSNPDNIYESREWYIHPTYNNLSTYAQPNDIALVKVQRPIVFTNLVRPIRIQPRADAYRNYDGEQVFITGHGRIWTGGDLSDTLKWVYLRAISNSECSRTFSSAILRDTTICARYYNVTSQSPCNGDFGAPLVHVGDGIPTLIGVFSFRMSGNDACHSGLPFGYVRPGPYLSWFEEVTGIDFDEQTTTTTTTSTTTPAPTTTTSTTTTTTPAPTTTTSTTTTPAPTTTTSTTTTPAPTTTTSTTTTPAPTTTTSTTTTPVPTTTTSTTTTPAPTTTTSTTTTPAPTTTTSTTTTPAPTTTTSTTTTPAPTTTTSTTTTPAPTTTTSTTTTPAPTTTTSTTTTPAPTTTTSTTTTPAPTTTTSTTTTPAPTTTTSTTTTPAPTTTTSTTTTTPAPTTTTSTTTTSTTPAPTTTTVTTPIYTTTPPTTTEADDGEGDGSGGSDCDKDDEEMAQLLKRLQVLVKVKVRMDKYNSTNAIGMESHHRKH